MTKTQLIKSQQEYLDVEHPVDQNVDIVLGDSGLVRNGNGLLLQGMHVGNPIDERNQEMDPRRQSLHVLAESLDHIRLLLRHYPNPPIHWRRNLIASSHQNPTKNHHPIERKKKKKKKNPKNPTNTYTTMFVYGHVCMYVYVLPDALVSTSAKKADWDCGGERGLGNWKGF
jgi:hypothetical protein